MEKVLYTYFWKRMPVVFALDWYPAVQITKNKVTHGGTFGTTHISLNGTKTANEESSPKLVPSLLLVLDTTKVFCVTRGKPPPVPFYVRSGSAF